LRIGRQFLGPVLPVSLLDVPDKATGRSRSLMAKLSGLSPRTRGRSSDRGSI
jgi:hypothetical protein